jgi:hypothetical protein
MIMAFCEKLNMGFHQGKPTGGPYKEREVVVLRP